jgi:hypothetical protein
VSSGLGYRTRAEVQAKMEFVCGAGLLWPVLNWVWWRPRLLRELDCADSLTHEQKLKGIVAYERRTHYTTPAFVNAGSVMMPVGGGQPYTQLHRLFSWYTVPETSTHYRGYSPIKGTSGFEGTTHVHTYTHLERAAEGLAGKEGAQKILDQWPMPGPLVMDHYHFKEGVWLHQPTGLLGTDKPRLFREIAWRKRLPFTCTVPAVAAVVIAADWLHWRAWRRSNLPAFHPERLRKALGWK